MRNTIEALLVSNESQDPQLSFDTIKAISLFQGKCIHDVYSMLGLSTPKTRNIK
jgi:hypothetical protein